MAGKRLAEASAKAREAREAEVMARSWHGLGTHTLGLHLFFFRRCADAGNENET